MHETTNRCNGHIQVSSPAGKAPKRDRKGCKKGKIEAIMKNSMGTTKPKAHIDSIFKKKTKLLNTLNRFSGGSTGSGISFGGITAGSVIKSEIIDDPYTFTDCEPQTPQAGIGLYLTSTVNNVSGTSCLGSNRKEQLQPHLNNINHHSHQIQSITNNSINSCSSITSSNSNCINSSNKNISNNNKNINVNLNGNVQHVFKSGDSKCDSTNINSSNKSKSNNNVNHNNNNNNSSKTNTSVNVYNKAVTSVPIKQQQQQHSFNNSNHYTYNKTISSNSGTSNYINRNINNNNNASSSSSSNSSSSSSSSSSSNCSSSSIGCSPSFVGNNNGIIDGSSKTMNKLQADIARNKVIVKRRRVVSQPSSSHDQGDNNSNGNFSVVKTELNVMTQVKQHQIQRTFARVSIPAKRLHRQTTWQRERRIRHEALQRIQDAQVQAANVKRDLFPLGLDATDSEDDDVNSVDGETDEVYQRHWFMGCGGDYQSASFSIRGRESRLTQLRSELRRRLRQVWRGIERTGEPSLSMVSAVVTAARTQPAATAMLIDPHHFVSTNNQKLSRAKLSMLDVKKCCFEKCQRKALPCTMHCTRHIMYNVDQQLFQHCSWKSDDRTQCRIPVFDIVHPAPLCPQHARKQDNNFKSVTDAALKKSRKKSKTSTLTRSNKRGKKKKKKPSVIVTSGVSVNSNSVGVGDGNPNNSNNINKNNINSCSSVDNGNLDVMVEQRNISDMAMTSSIITTGLVSGTTGNLIQSIAPGSMNTSTNIMVAGIHGSIERRHNDMLSSSVTPSSISSSTSSSSCIPISQVEIQVQLEDVVEEVPEEVLAIASLDPAELASQASRLLEDQDLTNMLNIPADAFNDLFTEDKNGEYEPTREETEELERALEAVDKDVRSLERMTRSMPLSSLPLETMTTLLDDPTVSSTIPGVYAGVGYPNGFTSSVQTDLRHS